MTEPQTETPSTGFIYFIRAGRTANVKIGYTMNPYKRIDGMQTSSPHTLYLIGYCPGDKNAEFDWHQRWRHLHVRGEWFRLTQDLRNAVNDRLSMSDARQYLRVAVDWRAVRGRVSQFHGAKKPPFMTHDEFATWHKTGHELGGLK